MCWFNVSSLLPEELVVGRKMSPPFLERQDFFKFKIKTAVGVAVAVCIVCALVASSFIVCVVGRVSFFDSVDICIAQLFFVDLDNHIVFLTPDVV